MITSLHKTLSWWPTITLENKPYLPGTRRFWWGVVGKTPVAANDDEFHPGPEVA